MIKNKAHMNTLKSLLTIISLSLISLAHAYSPDSDAKTSVKDTVDEVQRVVREAKPNTSAEAIDQELRKVIAPIFDFDEMSKRCLGVNWKTATPDEQMKFTELFSELLAKNYLKQIRLTAATSNYEITHANEDASKAVVQTKVNNDKGTLKVDYRLYNKNAGWKVYDVIIENIGLVSNYRSEFSEIVAKRKMSGLIELLKEKIQQNKGAEK